MGNLGLTGEHQNPALFVDNHGQLAEQSTAAQAVFNLFRFDPKAADLHLVIVAATKLDAVIGPFADIPCAVQASVCTVSQGHMHEALGAQLRIVQIAKPNARSVDVKLAGLLFGNGLQVVIEDQHPGVGDGAAKVARIVARLEYPRGCQHGGFGRPIDVVQLALPGQLRDNRGLAHIAAGDQVTQAKGLIERQDAQQRRG
ncbi:hypothetical protein D3C77_269490 [compost metagenome]